MSGLSSGQLPSIGDVAARVQALGQIDSYDLESDELVPMTLRPGEHTCLEKSHARGLTIYPARGTSSTATKLLSRRFRR